MLLMAAISRYARNIERELGVRFRPTTKCQHPLHGNQRRKVERGINLKMAKEIKARSNSVVPVSARILDCVLHLTKLCYVQRLRI